MRRRKWNPRMLGGWGGVDLPVGEEVVSVGTGVARTAKPTRMARCWVRVGDVSMTSGLARRECSAEADAVQVYGDVALSAQPPYSAKEVRCLFFVVKEGLCLL